MFFRNLSTLWIGQLFTKGVMFLAMALLARRVSQAEYGAVEYALGLATLATLVIEGGLGTVGIRRLSQHHSSARELSALVLSGQLILALLVLPLAMFAGWLFTDDRQTILLSFVILASVVLLPLRQEWLFQSLGLMNYIVASQIIRVVLFCAGVALFVDSASGVVTIGAIEVASVILASCLLLAAQYRKICPVGLNFSCARLQELYREGAAIAGSAILWAVTQYAPLFAFASQSSMSQTALFGAAHRLGVSLVTFSWLYHFNLYPLIARRMSDDIDSFTRLNTASVRVTGWLGTGLALGLTLCAEPLVVLLFGESYQGAALPFCLLVWTFPITIISGHARWSLIAAGHSRDVFVSQLLGAGATVGAAWLLVGTHGMAGAGIAMTIGCLAAWVTAHASAVKRQIAVPAAPSLLLFASAALITLAARSVDFNGWLECVAGLAAFLLVSLLLDRHLPASLRLLLNVDVRAARSDHAQLSKSDNHSG